MKSQPTINGLSTGYIQTPEWTTVTKEKPVIVPAPMDSWVNVSVPPAKQVMVTALDVLLVDPIRGGCTEHSLELWGTPSLPPDKKLHVRLSHTGMVRYC